MNKKDIIKQIEWDATGYKAPETFVNVERYIADWEKADIYQKGFVDGFNKSTYLQIGKKEHKEILNSVEKFAEFLKALLEKEDNPKFYGCSRTMLDRCEELINLCNKN